MADHEFPQTTDHAETDRVMFLCEDRMRLVEDEIWAGLSGDIAYGLKTAEEAITEFLAWRSGYKIVGATEMNFGNLQD